MHLQHKSWDIFCSENVFILFKMCQATIFWSAMVWSVLNQPFLNQSDVLAGWVQPDPHLSQCALLGYMVHANTTEIHENFYCQFVRKINTRKLY